MSRKIVSGQNGCKESSSLESTDISPDILMNRNTFDLTFHTLSHGTSLNDTTAVRQEINDL